MSVVAGKSNGKAMGQVIELILGDLTDDFDTELEMKKIFYWRTVGLTLAEAKQMDDDIRSPIENNFGLIINPKKIVEINTLTTADKVKLSVRGQVTDRLGGDMSKLTFTSTMV